MINAISNKKVRPKDLKNVGDEIRTFIEWNVLAETLETLKKVVGLNTHEVEVEEIIKRMDEIGASQNINTNE